MIGSQRLWNSPRIKTLSEICWERKDARRRRNRRLSLIFLYILIVLAIVIW